jgi:hypothetical protein
MSSIVSITENGEPMTHSIMLDNNIGYVLREDGKLTIFGTPDEAAQLIINGIGAKAIFTAVSLLHVDMAARKMEWLGENPPAEFFELQKAYDRLVKLLPFW